jgi:hypothetical protein
VTIWKERLSKLKRSGAAKNHKPNSAGAFRVTDKEKEPEQAKRADALKYNDKIRLGLG